MSQKNLKRYQEIQRNIIAARTTALTATPPKPEVPKKAIWLHSSSRAQVTTPMFPMPRQPIVLYTPSAWAKIEYMVRRAIGEVGWIGLVDATERGNYLITDVFLPKQRVNAANTIIDDYDRQRIMFELNTQGRYNDNLIYWGHSHVNMDVGPSITDEETVQDIIDVMDDSGGVYIRGIYNKHGDSKVDVYVKVGPGRGYVHQCVDNRVQYLLPDAELNALGLDFQNNIKDIPSPPQKRTPIPNGTVMEGVGQNGAFTKLLPDNSRNNLLPNGRAGADLIDDLDDHVSLVDDPEFDDIITLDKLGDPHYVEG